MAQRTLGVQEVADGHWVGAVGNVGRLEHLLDLCLGLEGAHVLLLDGLGLLLDIGVFLQLLDSFCNARRLPY